MDDARLALNPNKLAHYLGKLPEEFTKKDLIKFIGENGIEMVNFRYVAADGRLKTLNFVIHSREHLDGLLSTGERVDGSSLFAYIDPGSSDLYVVPRYKTAFVNPFAQIPTLDILCAYYTRDGEPLPIAPEHILKKAHDTLKSATGLSMEAMGELEYYIFSDRQPLYSTDAQKGYHESAPFSKWEDLRSEAMQAIAQAGGKIKYGHSEVGSISDDGQEIAQEEIEFLPVAPDDAADQVVIAKWALRMIGFRHGVHITFAPKVLVGHAGSGMHVHTKFTKDGQSVMIDGNGLSDLARKAVAGYLTLAPSLTAFGNTVPTSYLRLVPHQEAPTNICWGDRNRSVLVRVPLGWTNVRDMTRDANPQEKEDLLQQGDSQTLEFRCSDGSANMHLLLAGLCVAARYGLEMENALEVAEKLYVNVNIFAEKHKAIQEKLPQLPASCWDSAEQLLKQRGIYEKHGVFSPMIVDGIVKGLKSYDDKDLSERLFGKTDEIRKLVADYLHC